MLVSVSGWRGPRMVDPNVSYNKVHASRGKVIRAEPVAALYEQGRIHHVGAFPTPAQARRRRRAVEHAMADHRRKQGEGRNGVTGRKRGGADEPWNMQWQTIAEGKAKDATE